MPSRDRILIQYYSSEEEAHEAEIFFIVYFGRIDLETGCLYNRTNGGEGVAGLIWSKDSLERVSLVRKGKKKAPRTAEHCRKLSLAKIGNDFAKFVTADSRARRSVEMKGEGNVFYGKTHSPETRKLLSEMSRGRKASEETRRKMSMTQKKRFAAGLITTLRGHKVLA